MGWVWSYGEPTYPNYILKIIRRYLRERNERYGRSSRCFTYKGLHNWYAYSESAKSVREELSWHTIERSVRRLAEEGLIVRIPKSKKEVIFCLEEVEGGGDYEK